MKKECSDYLIIFILTLVTIGLFYSYFNMGKIIYFTLGIIFLLFVILLIYTSVSNMKNQRRKKSLQKGYNYFKNYNDLKQKLNNYEPKNKFGFVINFNEKNSNITQDYIHEFQNKYNVILPKILREYYLKYNKSDIKECNFYLYDVELKFSLEFIIPLYGANVNVEKILEIYKNDKYLQTFVPLAEDIEGDDFYWDKKTGKVFYIAITNVENPIPICDSVEEFFKLLNYVVERKDEKNK